MRLGSGGGRVDIFLRLTFARFQVGLAPVGGFNGVGAGLDLGFLREVTPARVPVFRTLAVFVLLYRSLGTLLAADNLDHAAGLISPHVVADDGVGKCGFVASCQRSPVCGRKHKPSKESGMAR